MKHPAVFAVACIAAAFLSLPPSASAQQPRDSMRRRMPDSTMMRMTAMHDSADARLDSLVRAMNAATGKRKVDAMAAVITELVDQRRMMREHMRGMMMPHPHPGMMGPGMRRHGSAPSTPPPNTSGH